MQRASGSNGTSERTGRAVRALLAVVALAASALVPARLAAQSPTPAGTVITSFAEATYASQTGQTYTAVSNVLAMTVAQVAGVDLTPARSAVANPGETVVFAHTLTNLGNGADSLAVIGTSAAGWPVRVYLDGDANGALGAADAELTGPVVLAMGAGAAILVTVDVPPTAAVRGTRDSVRVVAASRFDAAATDALVNAVDVQDVGVLVTLAKQVDRPIATSGDVLTYTITYTVTGIAPATNLVITDPIPAGAAYVPGSMRWNGAPLTDGAGDAGTFDSAGNRVLFQLGDVLPGQTGTVTFQVRISG